MRASEEITEDQAREVRVRGVCPACAQGLDGQMLFDVEQAYQEFFSSLRQR